MALLVVPLVTFGVVYSLQLKGNHDNKAVAEGQNTAPTAQTPVFNPTHPVVEITDGPPADNAPPIVAPMTTAVGEPEDRTGPEHQLPIAEDGN